MRTAPVDTTPFDGTTLHSATSAVSVLAFAERAGPAAATADAASATSMTRRAIRSTSSSIAPFRDYESYLLVESVRPGRAGSSHYPARRVALAMPEAYDRRTSTSARIALRPHPGFIQTGWAICLAWIAAGILLGVTGSVLAYLGLFDMHALDGPGPHGYLRGPFQPRGWWASAAD